jgi:hypothetical protein
MTELILQAGADHVARLAHESDPARAVIELIWNAIDAEATEVTVTFVYNEMDAISKTTVSDDGHGISLDELPGAFGRIGDSWKRLATTTKNGKRGLHGKLGEGRLRAFALGSRAEWDSHSRDTAGTMHRIKISGTTERRNVFPWDKTPPEQTDPGTVVTIWNDTQKSLATLEADSTLSVLRSHFAPLLLNEKRLQISYGGAVLNPSDEFADQTPIPLTFGETAEQQGRLNIIEWKSGKHRAVYYGADDKHFLYEESAKDLEPQFSYSAYVTWDGLNHDAISLLPLGDMGPGEVGSLWQAARRAIREHFTERRRGRRRDQVAKWKKDRVYPYEGEPKTESERAERVVFDVVSGTLSQQISSKRSDAQLTLTLLRDALRHDPDKLTTILHEVVALNDTDRDILTDLLSETTLSAIIKAANVVASRNKFLSGLEHLLFDPVDAGTVGERDHLHRLLERELWIFGEAYHLMSSERGLTEMLRSHLKLEGLPIRVVEPVKRWDGRAGRTDLHLAVKMQEFDRIRHLVVELKAPDITLGRKELDQLEDYANVVLKNSAFATDKAEWDFLLIGTDWDEVVENRISEDARQLGRFLDPPRKPGRPRVRAYVRRWRDVIDENRARVAFVTRNLEHDPTLEEGLSHIRAQYAELLPLELREDPAPPETHEE